MAKKTVDESIVHDEHGDIAAINGFSTTKKGILLETYLVEESLIRILEIVADAGVEV